MKKIIIIGAGSFGREILAFLKTINNYEVKGFIDSDRSLQGKIIDDIPVIGSDGDLENLIKDEKILCAFIAIAKSNIREQLYVRLENLGFELINIIHPSSVVVSNVTMGKGNVVYPNVTINTGVTIGNSVLINSSVSIGHDGKIGNFVNINPGVNVAGKVKIQDCSFLGIGCTVLENITIGGKAIIGGGALVRKNVMPQTTVIGVPAKEINTK